MQTTTLHEPQRLGPHLPTYRTLKLFRTYFRSRRIRSARVSSVTSPLTSFTLLLLLRLLVRSLLCQKLSPLTVCFIAGGAFLFGLFATGFGSADRAFGNWCSESRLWGGSGVRAARLWFGLHLCLRAWLQLSTGFGSGTSRAGGIRLRLRGLP